MKILLACFVLTVAVLSAEVTGGKVDLVIKDGVTARVPFCPPRDELSVSLWVKPEVSLFVNQLQGGPIASAGNGWNSGFCLQLMSRVDGTYFPVFGVGAVNEIGLNGQDPGGDNLIRRASARGEGVKILPGRWYHFCGTWDGINVKLYVDGKLVATDVSNRGYVRKGAEFFEAGTTTWLGDVRPLPHLSEKVAAWTRPLSAAEVAKLASDRPSLPDTPEIADILNRAAAGESFSTEKILSVVKGPLSPKGKIVLDGVLAITYLKDGDLASATAARDRYLVGLKRSRYTDFAVSDFEFVFANAMFESGFKKEALAYFKTLWEKACDAKEPWAPVAAMEYSVALARTGAKEAAAAVKKEAVETNKSGFFPHISVEAGVKTEFNARAQAGARVSAKMPSKRFYVAPNGDDAADGSVKRPFKTLLRARDAVRALKTKGGLPEGGAAVVLRGGVYRMAESLELDTRDSGTRDRPVVWCSYGDEKVVLNGGWTVGSFTHPSSDDPVMKRVPEEARAKVVVADVSGYPRFEQSIPIHRSGDIVADMPELFLDGRKLEPARYPDDRWLKVDAISGKVELGKYGNRLARGAVICNELDKEILAKWKREPDLMLTGYWYLLYFCMTSPAESIDTETGIIKLKGNPVCTEGGRFFMFNAAAALNKPGEWFLDRTSGRLYVVPPEGKTGGKYELASFSKPFVSAVGTDNLRIEGIVFECGRNAALSLSNCCDVVVGGNVVRNFSGLGLKARAVKNLTVADNVFRSFSCGALDIFGGDRKTLVHSGILIKNNEISDVEHRVRSYAPLLHLGYVGVEVSNNEFFNAPSSAMRLEGNDFWVVSNFVHDVVWESDDQGAVDIYRDPSYQGSRFCWNVWKNCSNTIPKGFSKRVFRGGIRFDGNISGQTVYANRFINIGTGEFGGVSSCGGRLNVVDNNIFIGCQRGMSFGVYPMNYWQGAIVKSITNLALNAETGVDIRKPPYSLKYPGIVKLFETDQINWLTRNVMVGPQPIASSPPFATVFRCNRRFATEPDWEKLERETAFVHVPTEDEVGPKPTPAFLRAKKNDGR